MARKQVSGLEPASAPTAPRAPGGRPWSSRPKEFGRPWVAEAHRASAPQPCIALQPRCAGRARGAAGEVAFRGCGFRRPDRDVDKLGREKGLEPASAPTAPRAPGGRPWSSRPKEFGRPWVAEAHRASAPQPCIALQPRCAGRARGAAGVVPFRGCGFGDLTATWISTKRGHLQVTSFCA